MLRAVRPWCCSPPTERLSKSNSKDTPSPRSCLTWKGRFGGAFAGALTGIGSISEARAAELGDDGLHKQDWFIDSFLNLRDDHQEAADAGKHFAIFWEQRGCPYCAEMHNVNLAKSKISNYVKNNFNVLQLDLYGSRNVVDFDGKEMSESDLAKRWKVNFTPTMVFFPADAAAVAGKPGSESVIFTMPGYFKPFHFLAVLEYVHEGHWKKEDFQRYLQRKFEAIKERGEKPEVW